MTTRLQQLTEKLRFIRWQGKHGIVGDDRAIARALLAELGVNGAERVAKPQERWVKTLEELDACAEGTVLRDNEARVVERWPSGWLMTGEEDPPDIDFPALVLWTPEDET